MDPDPAYDPPPPFSEVPDGEGGAGPNGTVTQDEQATELSGDQRAAEEKRQKFLRKELEKRQAERDKLQLDFNIPGKGFKGALNTMRAKLREHQDTLDRLQARLSQKGFSGTQAPVVIEVKSKQNGDFTKDVAEQILQEILQMDNAGPVTVRLTLPPNNRKGLRSKAEAQLQAFISECVHCALPNQACRLIDIRHCRFDFPSSTEGDMMILTV
ncbi:hypothetical protein EDC04DRAFT_1875785 [Pisolithus marmoratus]|nr:hypothetical protein EDC04DRAFT_1875785 [Pisolithus marmoratus]